MVDALSKIVAQDGVDGLWRGGGPAVQRAALVNLGELATYDSVGVFCLLKPWYLFLMRLALPDPHVFSCKHTTSWPVLWRAERSDAAPRGGVGSLVRRCSCRDRCSLPHTWWETGHVGRRRMSASVLRPSAPTASPPPATHTRTH